MSTQVATVGSATIERERVGLSRTLRGLVISRVRLTQLVILAVILVVWEVAGRRLGTFFLAPPSTLWAATKEMVASGDLQHAILDSLDDVSTLSVETASLIDGIREPFVKDIKELRTVAGNIDKNKAELDRALQVLPIKLNQVGRTATYGSWFNFYLCDLKGRVTITSKLSIPIDYSGGGDRCHLG